VKACPCGCGRQLGWSDRRIAANAALVVDLLPVVGRTAAVLERSTSSEAAETRAFEAHGVDVARRLLRVAHGDRSVEARRHQPGDGEAVAWYRVAVRLGPSLQQLDPVWWVWFEARGEPGADLGTGDGPWDGRVRGDGPPEPLLPD
jgi:hypothetical protein